MSRNGSGTYSLPSGNPVVTNTTISSTDFNNTMNDIATALTDSIAKDGQTTLTGNLAFSGNNIQQVGTLTIVTDIQHYNDTNNKVTFGTDTQDFTTGGSSRLDISDSGVRLGGANARVTTVLDEDTMSSDSATALITQQSAKAYTDTTVNTNINPNGKTSATVTTSDEFLFSDVDDSNNVKKDTVQGILDLAPSASDTAAGEIEVAVQSEVEAATSTTLAITPGRMHYHPGVAKCWVNFNGTGTIAINSSYNTQGITDNGTGDTTITIDNDFSSGNYVATIFSRRDTSAGKTIGGDIYSTSGNPAAGSLRIRTFDSGSTNTDMEVVTVAMFGDQ